MSDETTDEQRSDEDRKMGCVHGERWTVPCTGCNRTPESIRLTAFVDDLVKALRRKPKLDEDPVYHEIKLRIAREIKAARIKNFGKGGG